MSYVDRPIALCLSGGGFRATLFHLGVIKALRSHTVDGEMALRRVGEIYSVSGGSIVAAHFLRNYGRYTGTQEAFEEAEKEILAFVRKDVRNRVLRRWGLTFWLGGSRGFWLQRQYAKLIGGETIGECYRAVPDAPTFHFLATDFRTGELCSFTRTSFEKLRRVDGGVEVDVAPAGQIDLAFAVAASSSFPPLFPPIPLTPRMLGAPDHAEFASPIFLSDGGVYDNFGVDLLRLVKRQGVRPDVLLVSHAGGSFDTAPGKVYSSVVARNTRASDIMMRRVGESTLEAGQLMAGKGFSLIRIGAVKDDGSIEVATQQLLRLVRTDLDAFDRSLSRLLVDHGRRIAASVMAERGWIPDAMVPVAGQVDERALARTARRAAHRRMMPLFFDLRDWLPLTLWWLMAIGLCGATGLVAFAAWQSGTIEAREQEIQRQRFNDLSNRLEIVRAAVQGRDLAAVERALAGTIDATERLAADPSLGVSPPPAAVSPEETRRIVEAPQSLPPVDRTDSPQRVFIQFAGTYTRAQITSLNATLKRAGWRTQGASGERTSAAAGINEVRYSGTNRDAAVELAKAINQTGLPGTAVVVRSYSRIGPNDLELWISN